MKNKNIKIIDWAGNELFSGPYDSQQVDTVLDANRCPCRFDHEDDLERQLNTCAECEDTGYKGDFEIHWEDSANDNLNVYEFINY
jgi:hypothetical protein